MYLKIIIVRPFLFSTDILQLLHSTNGRALQYVHSSSLLELLNPGAKYFVI